MLVPVDNFISNNILPSVEKGSKCGHDIAGDRKYSDDWEEAKVVFKNSQHTFVLKIVQSFCCDSFLDPIEEEPCVEEDRIVSVEGAE